MNVYRGNCCEHCRLDDESPDRAQVLADAEAAWETYQWTDLPGEHFPVSDTHQAAFIAGYLAAKGLDTQ